MLPGVAGPVLDAGTRIAFIQLVFAVVFPAPGVSALLLVVADPFVQELCEVGEEPV
jgi:hypothetical protein